MGKLNINTVLAFGQIVLILGLAYMVVRMDGRLNDMSAALDRSPTAQTPSLTSAAQPIASPISETRVISAQSLSLIRKVVREEIKNMPAVQTRTGATPYTPASDTRSPADIAALDAQVDGKLNTLIAQGSVSPAQLESAYGLIATLPPQQRKAAMLKLNRAMNNGEIATRF